MTEIEKGETDVTEIKNLPILVPVVIQNKKQNA